MQALVHFRAGATPAQRGAALGRGGGVEAEVVVGAAPGRGPLVRVTFAAAEGLATAQAARQVAADPWVQLVEVRGPGRRTRQSRGCRRGFEVQAGLARACLSASCVASAGARAPSDASAQPTPSKPVRARVRASLRACPATCLPACRPCCLPACPPQPACLSPRSRTTFTRPPRPATTRSTQLATCGACECPPGVFRPGQGRAGRAPGAGGGA